MVCPVTTSAPNPLPVSPPDDVCRVKVPEGYITRPGAPNFWGARPGPPPTPAPAHARARLAASPVANCTCVEGKRTTTVTRPDGNRISVAKCNTLPPILSHSATLLQSSEHTHRMGCCKTLHLARWRGVDDLCSFHHPAHHIQYTERRNSCGGLRLRRLEG